MNRGKKHLKAATSMMVAGKIINAAVFDVSSI